MNIVFDGSTDPGTVVIEHAGLSFRAHFDSDAEALRATHALRTLLDENERLKDEARRVRVATLRLAAELEAVTL